MITTFFSRIFLSLGTLLVLLSCSSDNSVIGDNSVEIRQISDVAKSGTWRITNYIDSGKNETNDYAGYNFTFGDNGVLTASNGSNTITGTWSVTNDNSSSSSNGIDFNISLSSPPNFEELSDEWDIVSSGATKIDLIDISGGNGGTDTLTFEKN